MATERHAFHDRSLFFVSPSFLHSDIPGGPLIEVGLQPCWIRKWSPLPTPDGRRTYQRTCESAVFAIACLNSEGGPAWRLWYEGLDIWRRPSEEGDLSLASTTEDAADLLDAKLEALGAIPVPDGLWRNEEEMMKLWRAKE